MSNVIFDRGFCAKRNIDPVRFLDLFYGVDSNYQFIIMDQDAAAHFTSDDKENPIGVYPVWDATSDSLSFLEDWVQNPWGQDEALCSDTERDIEHRPVFGQDHVIIAHNIPDTKQRIGKRCLQMLRDIQQENPELTIHIHGLYTFMPLINMNFKSFDHETRTDANRGNVFLPNGRKVKVATEIHRHAKWVGLLGYRPVDLNIPRNRCVFNLRAIRWAIEEGPRGEAFARAKARKDGEVDYTLPDSEVRKPTRRSHIPSYARRQAGDMIECNTCSLADVCSAYRQDSICTLDGEMSELAKLFDTTDSKTILSGLSKLTAMSAARAERAMEDEKDFGLDPETTKVLKQTFEFAERYAKLNDPALRMNVNLNRDVGPGKMPIQIGVERPPALPDPNAAAAAAIEYYAAMGIERGDITSEMMRDFLMRQMQPQAIEAGDSEPVEAEIVR